MCVKFGTGYFDKKKLREHLFRENRRIAVLSVLFPRLGFGHTESGLPLRAAICACGGKAFELYYVRLHHPRQTEGGLTRRTGLS